MTEPQIRTVLESLFRAFPTLGEFYSRHAEKLRPVWIEVLSTVDHADATTIARKMIVGDLPIPANYEYDRTAILLRREANALRSERNARQETAAKYLRPLPSDASKWLHSDRTGHVAIELGVMVRNRTMSADENREKMEELMEWDSGGQMPEWLPKFLSGGRRSELLSRA